jgi:hypothetical protein
MNTIRPVVASVRLITPSIEFCANAMAGGVLGPASLCLTAA